MAPRMPCLGSDLADALLGVRLGIRDLALVLFQWPLAGEPLR